MRQRMRIEGDKLGLSTSSSCKFCLHSGSSSDPVPSSHSLVIGWVDEESSCFMIEIA